MFTRTGSQVFVLDSLTYECIFQNVLFTNETSNFVINQYSEELEAPSFISHLHVHNIQYASKGAIIFAQKFLTTKI